MNAPEIYVHVREDPIEITWSEKEEKNCKNVCYICKDIADESIKAAKEDVIEKAMKWIEYNNNNGGCLFDNWEEDFKKALSEL